jgi:hypothetical protein
MMALSSSPTLAFNLPLGTREVIVASSVGKVGLFVENVMYNTPQKLGA